MATAQHGQAESGLPPSIPFSTARPSQTSRSIARRALDCGGMELRCDLGSVHSAPELPSEQGRGASMAGCVVEHTRALPELETLAEEGELLGGRRVLELVLSVRDHQVPRDQRATLPRGG
jgi:hypothetical protein